jgi:hypothetical protein
MAESPSFAGPVGPVVDVGVGVGVGVEVAGRTRTWTDVDPPAESALRWASAPLGALVGAA